MEHLNQTLFLWLNAPENPSHWLVGLATLCAEWLILAIPLLLIVGWLRGNENARKTILMASIAGLSGLLVNQLIGMVWMHPRPFMMGIGHTLVAHAADSSLPSDHLTLWWAVALSIVLNPVLRRTGIALSLLGIPIAWARIYLGVHFPLDMLAAAAVATGSVWLTWLAKSWFLEPLYRLATRIHYALFGRWPDSKQ